MTSFSKWSVIAVLFGLMALAGGCRNHMPHSLTWPATGDQIPTHPKPPEGGYYSNWDPYAATIELTPVEAVNPVATQHVFIATVKDARGNPLPNRRVEWMIVEGVGAIVEVDESGWRASRGYKMDNRFAVSHTNNGPHTMTRGNSDPSDDIVLGQGQTWCVITSAVEGTTHVVAYCPAIYDWSKHKAFARKHWSDVAWQFPPEATNPIGTPHQFTTKVMRASDGTPLSGYTVTYKLLSGPPGTFAPGASVKTGADGLATVTLKQATPTEGVNEVQVDIARADGTATVQVATGATRKTWIGPKIAITKRAPATALAGQPFDYDIVVSNPSRVAATNAVLVDSLPPGIQYVASRPTAKADGQTLTWSLGTVEPGQNVAVRVSVKGVRTGKFTNCAKVTADYGLTASACADTVIAQPALRVTKTAPAEVLICEPITYSLVVTNTGDAPATGVKLSDKLPEGLLYQGRHGAVTADLATLRPGESKKIEYAVTASKTGTFTNSAQVTADGGLTAEATATTVVRQPVLAITKDAPKVRFVGRDVTYTITVSNKGDGPARDTVLTDTLSPQATLVSASDGGRASGNTVTWALGTLAPGQARTVTVVVRPTAMGELSNFASVTAVCTKASAKTVTVIQGIPAILLECIDDSDPIEVGKNVTYVITVTNQGSAPGTGIVVQCAIPAEQELVTSDGPTRASTDARTLTFAPLATLAPKAQAKYRVTVKALKVADVRFRIILTSDQFKAPIEETESTNLVPN